MLSLSGRTNNFMDYFQEKETPLTDEWAKVLGGKEAVLSYVKCDLTLNEREAQSNKLVDYYMAQGKTLEEAENTVMSTEDLIVEENR